MEQESSPGAISKIASEGIHLVVTASRAHVNGGLSSMFSPRSSVGPSNVSRAKDPKMKLRDTNWTERQTRSAITCWANGAQTLRFSTTTVSWLARNPSTSTIERRPSRQDEIFFDTVCGNDRKLKRSL
nr:hypothetical protein CFP56_24557 [Quercus suber]